MTIQKAARLISVSVAMLRRWHTQGKIPTIKDGIYTDQDVEQIKQWRAERPARVKAYHRKWAKSKYDTDEDYRAAVLERNADRWANEVASTDPERIKKRKERQRKASANY